MYQFALVKNHLYVREKIIELLSLPHLADDLESEEYASAKLFGKIADLEKKIEKLEAGEPRPITKEELEKVAAADELYRRIRHWNEKY